jgi:CheY-like chemotaxis protein
MLDKKKSAWAKQQVPVKTILVVEDDENIGTLLVQFISQETSYRAILVTDGYQALRVIEEMLPDLFVLDYQMPGMNGLELYDRLHTTPGLETIPAILVSAYLPQLDLKNRKIAAIGKPFELGMLLDTIEMLLT